MLITKGAYRDCGPLPRGQGTWHFRWGQGQGIAFARERFQQCVLDLQHLSSFVGPPDAPSMTVPKSFFNTVHAYLEAAPAAAPTMRRALTAAPRAFSGGAPRGAPPLRHTQSSYAANGARGVMGFGPPERGPRRGDAEMFWDGKDPTSNPAADAEPLGDF
jgi:hypothetical protein